MQLVIAEKPSVAQSIAKVLGVNGRNDGYMEGGNYIVSWCFGHLIELSEPDKYGDRWTGCWTYESLPIIPGNFKYEVSSGVRKQYNILKKLMNDSRVTSLVCATDAGREGELIFRLVYNQAECKKPFYRLWISSMEECAIKEGFSNLRPGREFDNLYASALCRQQADWLVGINGTRLFTVLYRGKVLRVGRVMTPTLAMVVDREMEVRNFKPIPYYQVEIDVGKNMAVSAKIQTKDDADRLAGAVQGRTALVSSVEKKEKVVIPPKLYDLTSLQRDANRLYGFTAKKTLDCTQNLYEKRLVTYPRTDARYLTDDMGETAKNIIKSLRKVLPFINPFDTDEPDTRGILNSSKVSDHHAIIPTVEMANSECSRINALPDDERKILYLIAERLLTAVMEPYRYMSETITLNAANTDFTLTGKEVINDGWHMQEELFRSDMKVKNDEDKEFDGNDFDERLTNLKEGMNLKTLNSKVLSKETKPQKRYTEDTLLSAMERAGASEMAANVERKGLGTPATRAETIEKLVRSGYVRREKKNLVPTDDGMKLITVLPEIIKSPKLTSEWENTLSMVAKGEYAADVFMRGIETMVKELIRQYEGVKEEKNNMFGSENAIGSCPKCGGDIMWGKYGPYCSERCGMSLKKAFGRDLSEAEVKELLAGRKILMHGLKSKNGGNYDAYLIPDGIGEYSYTNKDGEEMTGYQFKFKMEFPKKKED